MKIVTWNCQGAFRNKASDISAYLPDIAIIQECECPERLYKEATFARPGTISWFGQLETKGLAIMSYTGLEFELHWSYDPNIEYCIPLVVKGAVNFNLMAVWTQSDKNRKFSYIGQAYLAMNHYREFIGSADTLIIGDFNSNQIWDRKRSISNHTAVVNGFKDMGVVSLYHELNNEKHGSESEPTFFMYRKLDKPYHIDYCFVPLEWVNRVKKFEVGAYTKWCSLSDHTPLSVEFEM